ncbi:MAG: TIGR03862 family flavoprotein [Alphaproteobacteria bacterium]|nr:TIGR03862 family flavoprotein [Alphaproteobacteria bacterium]
MRSKTIAIIGGGPAGLMAADILSARGFQVSLYERKPSVGRKLLMAGRGGLNLTHSEDIELFIQKYGDRAGILESIIHAFPPSALRAWCEELGEKTFIGSSGRIFPENFKASPLLRAWTARMEKQGVHFMPNYEWQGWAQDHLTFKTSDGTTTIKADAVLLALGGASWPRLGSDGLWVSLLEKEGVTVAPLQPSNCGFCVHWSSVFLEKFAGHPLKGITICLESTKAYGEIMITAKGVEGGAIYALSSLIREEINKKYSATIHLDLKPDINLDSLKERLQKPRGRKSFSNYLRGALNLPPVAIGLLMELPERTMLRDYSAHKLASLIKKYPLTLQGPFPIDRAISTAGGAAFESVNEDLMLLNKPGVFLAGEMLDWEAPTGGYLLQATIATGAHAARGIIKWLENPEKELSHPLS